LGSAGSLIALGAYVYLLGGLVLWLRYTAARLPTDDSVGALDSNRLLAVGMKALVFELLVIGALLLVAILIWNWMRKPDEEKTADKAAEEAREEAVAARAEANQASANAKEAEGDADWSAKAQRARFAAEERRAEAERKKAEADAKKAKPKIAAIKRLLHLLIASILVATVATELTPLVEPLGWSIELPWWACAAIGLGGGVFWAAVVLERVLTRLEGHRRTRWWLKTGLTVIAAAIAITLMSAPAGLGVLVLLLFLHLSHLLKKLPTVSEPETLIPAVLVVTSGLSLVVAAYLATPPVSLDETTVVVDGTQRRIHGGYIGQSGDAVYVAGCKPSKKDPHASETTYLRAIKRDLVRRVAVGNGGYVFDYGTNPSLLDLGRSIAGQSSIGEWTSTVSIDVRGSKLTCGLRHVLSLGSVTRDRYGRDARQEASTYGAGTVRLVGKAFRPQERHPGISQTTALRLRLKGAVRRAHRCEGPFVKRFRVKFWPLEGEPETRRAQVKMLSIAGPERPKRARACRQTYVHRARELAPTPPNGGSNAR
jgi:hypothetical protein